MTADITIVGTGITGVEQVTREAERALRQATRIFYNDPGVATGAWLASLGPPVQPLWQAHYGEGGSRVATYRAMAIDVVEAALDEGPVALAIHGHPLVFVYTPFLVRDMADLLGLEVRVLPGVSATACLFAELMLDPGVSGLLMYEATDLLLRRRTLVPDVPLILWQVGQLETRLHTRRRSTPERLVRLHRALSEAYPPTHPVTALHVSHHPLLPSIRQDFPLSELCERAPTLDHGVTLYLPPATTRPVADPELLAQLDSPAHLDRITAADGLAK